MKKVRKFFKFVINAAAFIFMLYCFGNIQKDINSFLSLLGAIASMLFIFYQGYKAGWCYEFMYERSEEE